MWGIAVPSVQQLFSCSCTLFFPFFSFFHVSGVLGAGGRSAGIGPAVAIPAAVSRAGLELSDVDVFELNEAFASQATYCVKVRRTQSEREGGGEGQ